MQYQESFCRLSAHGVAQQYVQCMQQRGYTVEAYGSGRGGATSVAAAQPSTGQLPAFYHTMTDECRQLYYTRDYTEGMRLARHIAAYPNTDVAFAGIPIVPEFQGGHSVGFTTGTAAASYADCLAGARGYIGDNYFFGRGVAQDYAESAKWYELAITTEIPPDSGGGVVEMPLWQVRLGLLYAYGLGVSRDPERAKQLWTNDNQSGAEVKGSDLTQLMNNNALPKTMGDWNGFLQAVNAGKAQVEAKEAQQRALAGPRHDQGLSSALASMPPEVREAGAKAVALCLFDWAKDHRRGGRYVAEECLDDAFKEGTIQLVKYYACGNAVILKRLQRASQALRDGVTLLLDCPTEHE
jgi:hypothetical protein